MDGSANPLLPAGYDVAWTIVSALMIVLLVVALVSMARSAGRITATAALVWALLVICVPVVGPIAWLAVGWRSGLVRTPAIKGE
ncbi:PLDc N-terminal domain-containing protein [Cryobacterium sp. SO2]|uniref:PLDc N-terminal domain-containing protein n=1 Tax=Cryobacterium sp. SO2 TaxID=1897060 RepID=UPI00223DB1DC|nr:PLDc N-terminal domain-containing protein [Cryobacterium sp. SO2]WEO78368.1 PLDc N-terminal domain-containing protein [Cryobacterium sp. SO2]